jgi:hypothetical protein
MGSEATNDAAEVRFDARKQRFSASAQSAIVLTIRCASGTPFILSKTREGATLSIWGMSVVS